MEEIRSLHNLDEALFDHLLSFLTPKDAARLGCTSVLFNGWSAKSRHWRSWCEKEWPSLKTSPAREVVQEHNKLNEDFCKLYRRLSFCEMRSGLLQGLSPKGCCNDLQLQDVVMLFDVYLENESILAYSAEAECGWGEGDHAFRGLLNLDLPEAKNRLALMISPANGDSGLVQNFGARSAFGDASFSFSGKLLRKFDGRLLTLVTRQAKTFHDWQRSNDPKPPFCRAIVGALAVSQLWSLWEDMFKDVFNMILLEGLFEGSETGTSWQGKELFIRMIFQDRSDDLPRCSNGKRSPGHPQAIFLEVRGAAESK
jgi:hypothetical protein